MLSQHETIFKLVASLRQCHILLRSPNRSSDRFIGDGFFTAKPLHCKAKTANNQNHRFAGLVVSPFVVPQAFDPSRLPQAKTLWDGFAPSGKLPPGYSLATGVWNGCLCLNGKKIHADYDLLAAVPKDNNDSKTNPALRAEETTNRGMLTPYMRDIMRELNQRFGCQMVTHGAEFDADVYNYGSCDHFYPDGRHEVVTYTGQADPKRNLN